MLTLCCPAVLLLVPADTTLVAELQRSRSQYWTAPELMIGKCAQLVLQNDDVTLCNSVHCDSARLAACWVRVLLTSRLAWRGVTWAAG